MLSVLISYLQAIPLLCFWMAFGIKINLKPLFNVHLYFRGIYGTFAAINTNFAEALF